MLRPLAIVIALVFAHGAAAGENSLFARWWTKEDRAQVEIGPCPDGQKVCGTLVWLREPLDDDGKPKLDKNNPEESLRTKPLIGIHLLNGFVSADDGEWEDGLIYDPEDGRSYSSNMTLNSPDSLAVEGCILFFCREQLWRRVKEGETKAQ